MNFKIKQIVKITMQNVVFPVAYQLGKLHPVQKKLVIFADSHHNEVPYSMEDLHHWFEQTDYRLVTMTRDCDTGGYAGGLIYMLRFMFLYAQAKYVFLCDNFLPAASCKKRKETTVVQLWHAGGMLKKYAYDTARDIPAYYKGNVFRNYSLILTSDEHCNPAYISGMRADPKVVKALGLSRTDRFYQESYKTNCRKEFEKEYPQAAGKKIALWAPTFRGNASVPEIIDTSFIEELQKKLGEEWMLLVKLHPHLQKHIGLDACRIPTERLLPITDVLISDYSSVIYDYLLLERPIVFYVPDLNYYIENNQFYIDYQEMPGQIIQKEEELATAVAKSEELFEPEVLIRFKEKYMGACDGHARERLISYLKL